MNEWISAQRNTAISSFSISGFDNKQNNASTCITTSRSSLHPSSLHLLLSFFPIK
jgi:hypothetical protein